MGSISRYDNVPEQSVVNTYVPLPYNEIMQNLAMKEHVYNQAQAQRDENENNFLKVKALTATDKTQRDTYLNEYRKQMSDAYDKAKGDYGQLGEFAKGQANKIKSDLAYGHLGAIHNNYLTYHADADALDKQVGDKENGISADTAEALKRIRYQEFDRKGSTQQLGGSNYSQYKGGIAAKQVNLEDRADKLIAGWKANTTPNGLYDVRGGQLFKHGTTEVADENEIRQQAHNILQNDHDVQNHLKQDSYIKSYGQGFNQDQLNAFHSKNALDQITNAANFAAEKHGYIKQENKYLNNQAWLTKYKDDLKHKDNFVIENQSTLVPGENFSLSESTKNLSNINNQLSQVNTNLKQGVGNAYELDQQRQVLEKQAKIIKNSLENSTASYYKTPEGQKYVTDKFKEFQHVFPKSDIKTAEDFRDYALNADPLPWYKRMNARAANNTETGFLDRVGKNLRENIENHIKTNPVSYSANVLTGGKDTRVGKLNEALTKRVNDNGTNYFVEGGAQLDQYLQENVPDGGHSHVTVMDKDINGEFAHQLSITDKQGRIIKQVPIYPKTGAREEQDMVGRTLMEDNATRKDQNQDAMFRKGLQMRANATYPQINKREIDTLSNIDENKKESKGLAPITITNGQGHEAKLNVNVYRKTTNGHTNTYYQLVDNQGNPIKDFKEEFKDPEELKVALYQRFH